MPANPSRASAPDAPELDASFYDEPDTDQYGQDFDAWWSAQTATRPTAVIKGITVPVPDDVPADVAMRPESVTELDDESDIDEVKRHVIAFFNLMVDDGAGLLDELIEAGIGMQQLAIVLAWCMVNGMRPAGTAAVSFGKCAQTYQEARAEGKAPRPTPRDRKPPTARPLAKKATSGRRSASTGR